MVSYTGTSISNNPYLAQTLASALVRLINSTDALFLAKDLLSAELYFELAESHFKLTKTDAVYGLKNTHLFDSLSSGFSFKYKLSKSSEMYGCIEEGLHAQHGSPEETEILLVGTCISSYFMVLGFTRNIKKSQVRC